MYRLIFLFLFSFVYGIEIDTSIENNLSKNDTKNRFILAKYYFDKNLTKSEKFINEILNINPSPQSKAFLKKIKLKKEFNNFFKDKDIKKFYQTLYFENRYNQIKKLSKYLPIIKEDYPKLITAKLYLWDGDYKKTNQILKLIKNKNSLDYIEIIASINFYSGNYTKAKKYYTILYNGTYKKEYGYKLIDCYIFLDEIEKANKLIYLLSKTYKNDKTLQKLKAKTTQKTKNQITKLENLYQKTQKFEDLQKLVYLLLNLSQEDKAYLLLQQYIDKHPKDENAKFWYAKYLSWNGDNKKALQILEKIVTDNNYKVKLLLAKIYSWNGEYLKAINYLNDIISNSQNKDIIIQAKQAKGLIYYWQHDYTQAKPILQEVVKQKPLIEAKEALMVINGNIRPLIKKYKLLLKKDPTNLDYILKIAQFSEVIKDIDGAIEYYEKYYNLKQNINVAHTLAKLYLIKKNPYKAFSFYEFWAYQKGDKDSLFELANNYYYTGYSKSALSVINDILNIDNKYKKALKLKAKILQYSPKFTQENSTKSLTDIFSEKDSKLLSMANRLYFNGFYDDSKEYYKAYILSNPNDYEIRQRYAYSLEFSGAYKQASGEFFLLTWNKKDCDILYHYGVCLEKSNKPKLAKKAFKEALSYAKKPLPKFLQNFIISWKQAWESQDIDKYKKFYISKYTTDPIWIIRKENIFRNVKFISLYLAGYTLTKQYTENNKTFYSVKFYQQYTTDKKSDKGYKNLLLECQNQKCLISKEWWEKGDYTPTNYRCYKLVSDKLNLNQTLNLKALLKNYQPEIILDKANKKHLLDEDKVFSKFVVKIDKNTTKPRFLIPQHKTTPKTKNNNFGLKGEYYQDKQKIEFIDYGVYYKNNNLYLALSKWKLFKSKNQRNGEYLNFNYGIDKFIFGIEAGEYEDYSYIYPYIEYNGDLNIKYYQSLTGKDKKSFCGIDNNLTTKHFVVSKYESDTNPKMTKFWWSFDISKIDNNLELTPQFLYKLKSNRYKNIDYYWYLSGWYQNNSEQSDCYYSPSFTDSTYLELHPLYKNLEAILKLGYSFDGESFLYSYGLNYKNDYIDFKCMKNHSYKDDISNYWYEECFLDVKVKW